MKKIMTIFGAILFASEILASYGCGSIEGDAKTTNENLSKTSSIASTKSNDISNNSNISDTIKIKEFVKIFYLSLELSPELNQKNYEEGGVKFDKSIFNSCLNENSIYSEKRVSNLTGEYHDRYYIGLIRINSININNNIATVHTFVNYEISEVGGIENEEILQININNDNLTLNKWEDVKVKKMTISQYEGLENFGENDFYGTMGSINK